MPSLAVDIALAAPPVTLGLDEDAPEPDDRLCFPGDVTVCVDDDEAPGTVPVLLDPEAAVDGANEERLVAAVGATTKASVVAVVGFEADIVL